MLSNGLGHSCVIENRNLTFRSQDHSLPGAKVLGVELSLPGTFTPWNFRSQQWIQQGAYSLLLCAYICYTLWTTIIETSQLNVTKRLPIGLLNILGFVITQRRVCLPLFVRRQAASPSAKDVCSHPRQTLRVLGHVCGRRPDHVRVTAQVFSRIRPGQPVITLTLH